MRRLSTILLSISILLGSSLTWAKTESTKIGQHVVRFSPDAHEAYKSSWLLREAIKKLISQGECGRKVNSRRKKVLVHADELPTVFGCVVSNRPHNVIIFSNQNPDTSLMWRLHGGSVNEAYFVALVTEDLIEKIAASTLFYYRDGGGNRLGGRHNSPHPRYVNRPWYRVKLLGDTDSPEFWSLDEEFRALETNLANLKQDLEDLRGEMERLVDTSALR